MDGSRFDRLAQGVATGLTRRRTLEGLVAGAAVLVGLDHQASEAARKRGKRVQSEGPCGDGSGKANRCKRDGQCCTGYCNRKKGRCRCKQAGQSCQEDRNCCATAGQPMTCQDSGCVSGDPPPPPVACTALGDSCAPGADPCCTDQAPDAVCGSTFAGVSPANRTCQDCSQPPTAEGAYCQTPNGNQCCGGRPECWAGVRVDNGEPACVESGQCSVGSACTVDSECPSGQICLEAASGCGCSTGTFCGTPCS